jgi:hypothetical protein
MNVIVNKSNMPKITDVKSPWGTLDWSKLSEPSVDTKIYNDRMDIDHDPVRRIFINLEPESIIKTERFLIDNYKKFKFILTFNKNVLNKCRNAVKYIFGTTWIREADYLAVDLLKKEYKISMMCGRKQMAVGHTLRLQLYFNQSLFVKYPITFWRSSAGQLLDEVVPGANPLLGRDQGDKIAMFETYQFHFAIENSRQHNYFSEKLIDCLLTKTIPIYYGAPNIGDFFDTRGWIILEDVDLNLVQRKLTALSPDYYDRYRDVIEKNYEEAKKYIDIYASINDALVRAKW